MINVNEFCMNVYNFINAYHGNFLHPDEQATYARELADEINRGVVYFMELEELKNTVEKSINPIEQQLLQNLIIQFEQIISERGGSHESSKN